MIKLKLKEVVNNSELKTLNGMQFLIKPTGTVVAQLDILTLDDKTCTLKVLSGDAILYQDAACLVEIGSKTDWIGGLKGLVYIKLSSDSVFVISSKYNVGSLGTSSLGVLSSDGVAKFYFDMRELAGTNNLEKSMATFEANVTGSIENLSDNTKLENVTSYQTQVVGDVYNAIVKSKDTIKTLNFRDGLVVVDMDKFSIFDLDLVFLPRYVRGNLRSLRSSSVLWFQPVSEGEVSYIGGSALPQDCSNVQITYAVLSDIHMKSYMNDLSLSTWKDDLTCSLTFVNENDSIIENGIVIDADVIGYTSVLKGKGVSVTINGIAQ